MYKKQLASTLLALIKLFCALIYLDLVLFREGVEHSVKALRVAIPDDRVFMGPMDDVRVSRAG